MLLTLCIAVVSLEYVEGSSGKVKKRSKILTSLKRYYSNSFRDALKQVTLLCGPASLSTSNTLFLYQDAINLFLGLYRPYLHFRKSKLHLWELDSDLNLHNPSTTTNEAMYPHGIGGIFGGYEGLLINKPFEESVSHLSRRTPKGSNASTLAAAAREKASAAAEIVGAAQPIAPGLPPAIRSPPSFLSAASFASPEAFRSPSSMPNMQPSAALMSPRSVLLAEARGLRGVELLNVDRPPRDSLGRQILPPDWWKDPLLEFQANGLPVLGMPQHLLSGKNIRARVWSPVRDARGKQGMMVLWDGRSAREALGEPGPTSFLSPTSQRPRAVIVRYSSKAVMSTASLVNFPRGDIPPDTFPGAEIVPAVQDQRYWEQLARDETTLEISTPLLWGAKATWSHVENLTPVPYMQDHTAPRSPMEEGSPEGSALVPYGDKSSPSTAGIEEVFHSSLLRMGTIARWYAHRHGCNEEQSPVWLLRCLSRGGAIHNTIVHDGIIGAEVEPVPRRLIPHPSYPLPDGYGIRPTPTLKYFDPTKVFGAPFFSRLEERVGKQQASKGPVVKSVPSTLTTNLPPTSSVRHFKPDTGKLAWPEGNGKVHRRAPSGEAKQKPRQSAPAPWTGQNRGKRKKFDFCTCG